MPIIKLTVEIAIESDESPDKIAEVFESGAEHALESFPHGDVFSVNVIDFGIPTDEEINEKGWKE